MVEALARETERSELKARFADEAAFRGGSACARKGLELAATFDYLAARASGAKVRHPKCRVPKHDVIRRFSRNWQNFHRVYRLLADRWAVYDNSGDAPRLLERSP